MYVSVDLPLELKKVKTMQEITPTFDFIQPGSGQSENYRPITTTTLVRPIELLYYHEYEPADSDSSGEESVDEEPTSEDEWAIDDESSEPDLPLSGVTSPVPNEIAEPKESTIVQANDDVAMIDELQPMDIDKSIGKVEGS